MKFSSLMALQDASPKLAAPKLTKSKFNAAWQLYHQGQLRQVIEMVGHLRHRASSYITEALTYRALQLEPRNVHYRIELVSLMIQLDRDDEAIAAMGDMTEEQIHTIDSVISLGRVEGLLRRYGRGMLADHCDRRVATLQSTAKSKTVFLVGAPEHE